MYVEPVSTFFVVFYMNFFAIDNRGKEAKKWIMSTTYVANC